MDTTNKNKPNQKNEEDKDQAQTTSPVNLKSGDKLRENPSNDEETISQIPRKEESEKTALPRKEDEQTQVTNEDDQKDIVNPTEGDRVKEVN